MVQSLIQWVREIQFAWCWKKNFLFKNVEGDRSESQESLESVEQSQRQLKAEQPTIEEARTPSPEVIQEGRKPSLTGARKASIIKTQTVQNHTTSKPEPDEESDDEDEYRDLEGKIRTAKGTEVGCWHAICWLILGVDL